MTSLDDLQRAAIAWRNLKSAESEISRLNRYTNKTAGMKDDYRRHCNTAHESRKTLDSILKAPKP